LVHGVEPSAVGTPTAGGSLRSALTRKRALAGHGFILAWVCLAWSCGNEPQRATLAASAAGSGAQRVDNPAPDGSGSVGTGSIGTGSIGTGSIGTGSIGTDSVGTGSVGTGSGASEAVPGDAPLVGGAGNTGGSSSGDVNSPVPPDTMPPATCAIVLNAGSATDTDVNIDLGIELQRIAGFGGMDGGFYPELTAAQVDSAFGNGPGQLGLSIIRIRVPETAARFPVSVAAAARASQLGALVMATPWSPPAEMKSNGSVTGGTLNVESYGAYADHLLSYRDFMQANGAPLYAISVQNEPDIQVTYESCDWTPQQLVDWIRAHGAKFEGTQLMAPESTKFDRAWSDPLLQDPEVSAHVDIVGGHVYGGGVADYLLAREQGKEVWMTEHYHDSAGPANQWPLALGIGTDVHRSMVVNFNAYVWWAIRRAYGLLTEDGVVSKRGYVMAQYSKFIRPGFVRVSATEPANAEVAVTAYKGGNQLVVVALNRSTTAQAINLDVFNGCASQLSRFTTSAAANLAEGEPVTLVDGRATVTLEAESATTFVSL
jgi:glucuronoarabinoxylan endo-1,4-beta-xylanase